MPTEKRIDVRPIRKLGSNIRCIDCPEWSVVMIWIPSLAVDVPLCDACRESLASRLQGSSEKIPGEPFNR